MPAFPGGVTPDSLVPGTEVSVPVFLVLKHKAIFVGYSAFGVPMVVSNSARTGCVTEEPWDTFAAGKPVTDEGYSSELPPAVVVSRVRSLIGTKYDLLKWNCEHVVRYAHGKTPESPQVAATAFVAVVAGII